MVKEDKKNSNSYGKGDLKIHITMVKGGAACDVFASQPQRFDLFDL